VDLTTIKDMTLDLGLIWGYVYVQTSDPSVKDGAIRMKLTRGRARLVHQTIKNLWEEDQLKLGKKAEDPF